MPEASSERRKTHVFREAPAPIGYAPVSPRRASSIRKRLLIPTNLAASWVDTNGSGSITIPPAIRKFTSIRGHLVHFSRFFSGPSQDTNTVAHPRRGFFSQNSSLATTIPSLLATSRFASRWMSDPIGQLLSPSDPLFVLPLLVALSQSQQVPSTLIADARPPCGALRP